MNIYHYDVSGLSGVYARVKRIADGKWFDNANDTWITTAAAACNITLAETPASSGIYYATNAYAGFNVYSELFDVYIYTSAGVQIRKGNYKVPENQRSALTIITDVQKSLRYPSSAAITNSHAVLLLGLLNEVYLNHVLPAKDWTELLSRGSFQTADGTRRYKVFPFYGDTYSKLTSVFYNGSELVNLSNKEWKEKSYDTGTTEGVPGYWRVYLRSGKFLIIELYPIPSTIYEIEFEGYILPAELSAATDVPLLDDKLLKLGLKAYATKEQGSEWQSELALFERRLAEYVGTEQEFIFDSFVGA